MVTNVLTTFIERQDRAYKSQNFKFKLQQKTFNKKDAEIRLDIPKVLLLMKNHL